MNCKSCGNACVAKVSKSQSNFGKEFYSCPSGCQGWIGWVDPSMNIKKAPVERKPAKMLPNAPKDDYFYNKDGDIACKSCGTACMIKRSKTEKNMNKEYYACQNNCNVWNGWVNESTNNTDSTPPTVPDTNTTIPANTKTTVPITKTTIISNTKTNTTNTVPANTVPVNTKTNTTNTKTTVPTTTKTTIPAKTNTPTNTKKNTKILIDDDDYGIDEHDEY